MVLPFVKTGVFYGHNIPIVLHYTDGASVSAWVGTNAANFGFRYVVAIRTKSQVSFEFFDDIAELIAICPFLFNDMQYKTQGRFFSNTR